MILLTDEEKAEHTAKIKKIREKAIRARSRFCDGDITVKKLKIVEKAVKAEEQEYLNNSKVILYYGNLFRSET